ncbi:hypothetical protein BG46_06415 [Brucella anthropi]|nr:hypothetical protein BG46_06415 [Brucella anthropi]
MLMHSAKTAIIVIAAFSDKCQILSAILSLLGLPHFACSLAVRHAAAMSGHASENENEMVARPRGQSFGYLAP